MNATTATEENVAPKMGWQRVRLGDVCRVVGGSTPKTGVDAFWNGDIVWVTPTDLGRLDADYIQNSERHITPDGYASCGAELVPRGSVVMSSRAPIGHLAVAARELCTNQGCKTFVPSRDVDSLFLLYRLKLAVPELQALGSGATFDEVSKSQCAAFEIDLPPLPEQRRIAAALRAQLNATARMRAAVDCHDACMAAFAEATLQTAFADAAVAGACRVPLGDVCSIESPQVNPTQPQFGSLPHVSGENIESTTGRLLDLRSAADDGMISGKYLFEPGDVLYSKLRPYLRKVALVDFRGICSADMYPLRADRTKLDSRWLKWLLLSTEFTTYADEESRRARMPKLNREQLFAFKAPMPELPEQQRIAAALQHRFDAALSIRTMTAELAEDIGRLPAALLRRAFSPADPQDS